MGMNTEVLETNCTLTIIVADLLCLCFASCMVIYVRDILGQDLTHIREMSVQWCIAIVDCVDCEIKEVWQTRCPPGPSRTPGLRSFTCWICAKEAASPTMYDLW